MKTFNVTFRLTVSAMNADDATTFVEDSIKRYFGPNGSVVEVSEAPLSESVRRRTAIQDEYC